MLVFSTRLPLRSGITEEDCLNLFVEWITQSPHYSISVDEIKLDKNSHKDYDFTKENITFSIKHFKNEHIELSACRLENREPYTIWDNDCIFLNEQGKKTLLIQLNCTRVGFNTGLPKVHKPYIIRLFIEKGFCDTDGEIPITDSPITANSSNYSIYRDIMRGTYHYEMPMVYISGNYLEKPVVSPEYLAQQLGGVAHVFVEESHDIAARLREDTDGNNAYLGYVGIYFPHSQYCQRHGIEYYNNDREMCTSIIDDIWSALMNGLDSTHYSWNQIIALQARQKMLKLNDVSVQSKNELANYINTFDAEKNELAQKVEELNKQVHSLRAERDGLREARSAEREGSFFYKTGTEKELYPGERNDLLYSILSQVLNKYEEGTRANCIVRALLEANPKVGNCEKIVTGIKEVFSRGGKLNRTAKSTLRDLGFTIDEDGPHYKITFYDSRYMFTVAKTPSDNRHGGKNITSDICKIIDIDKNI